MNSLRTISTTAMTLLLVAAAHAQPSLIAPDAIFLSGSTDTVDIAITNAPIDSAFTGVDLFVKYDSAVATAGAVITDGTATDGWTLASNVVDVGGGFKELRISMASSDSLNVPVSGALVRLEFTVATAITPTSTPLEFTLAELNETARNTTTGSISIGGVTSVLSLSSAVTVGGDVTLTIVDPDLAGLGPITATITNTDNGDSETITLTDGGTGTFTGTITTAYGTVPAGTAGELEVQAGDAVGASFDDPFAATGGLLTVVLAPGDLTISGGVTSVLSLSTGVTVGGDVTLTIIDADLAGLGPITATITNTDNGDSETITLTDGGTGTFTGTITTAYGTVPAGTAGELEVQAGDAVGASFDDPFAATGGLLTVVLAPGDLTISGGVTSVLSLSTGVTVGGDVTLTIIDADLAGLGPITATITNTDNGDSETITLTDGGTGTFAGTITTAYGTVPAGTAGELEVKAGDAVGASFDDPFSVTGGPVTVVLAPGDLTISGGVTAVVSLSSAVTVGGDVTVTVVDADLAGQGPITATITNTSNGDSESVTLTDAVTPGTFTGTITTAYGTVPAGTAGELEVKAGDAVGASFDDPLSVTGGPVTVVLAPGDLTISGGVTAVVSLSPGNINPGDDITVTVVDADLAGQGPITATITNTSNGDSESVTLTDAVTPGTFTGTIPTVFGTVPGGTAGELDVKAGDAVGASFDDPFSITGGPLTVVLAPGDLTIGSGTTATMALAPDSLSAGDDIIVTITDPDFTGQGPITAYVVNSTTGDTVSVLLTELSVPPAAGPGVFQGAATTVFDSSLVGDTADNLLGIAPGHTLTAFYTDPLNDVGGPELISPPGGNELTILAGNDGSMTASAGVQAGGTHRIEVTDPDLNTSDSAIDTAVVTVTNYDGANDVETVKLPETGVNTGVFRIAGGLPTSSAAGSAQDGTLQVSPLDSIVTTYIDELAADGDSTTVAVSSNGTLWGDTSKNGTVRALDASLILQENVDDIVFDAYQTLVGDVSAPGVIPPVPARQSPLTSFDAVLILRYVVGLETGFPEVESGAPVHPYKRAGLGRRLAIGAPEAINGRVQFPLLVSEMEDLVAGNLSLAFNPAQIRITGVSGSDVTGDFMIASRVEDGQVKIAFAGTESRGVGQGSILRIAIEPLGDVELVSPLTIASASINGGQSPVDIVDSPEALSLPQAFLLGQNWPNPFNPETQIRYSLPQDTDVRLTIYDALGQTVTTLVKEQQTSGDYTIRWNARNADGYHVASGLYFYRLEAGSVTITRKMSLLR